MIQNGGNAPITSSVILFQEIDINNEALAYCPQTGVDTGICLQAGVDVI
ncbi:MAG: hypothetical protein FWH55_03065 [Oscillospiraceae bacterium]|nr:hypothetical protein [Oscillospiraceae bacterium]